MQETENKNQFFMIENIPTEHARNNFLAAAKDNDENRLHETAVLLMVQLQIEANQRWPKLERNLWLHYQLAETYAKAELWEDALIAVDDLQILASNLDENSDQFDRLEDSIIQRQQ